MCSASAGIASELREAFFAELVAVSVGSLDDTIAKHKQAVPAPELDISLFIRPARKMAENCARIIQRAGAAILANQNWRTVSGIAIREPVRLGVEDTVEERYEFVGGHYVKQNTVRTGAYLAWLRRFSDERFQSGLQIGHQQGGGESFSGCVSNAKGCLAVADSRHIVIVAAYKAHRLRARRNGIPRNIGNYTR